MGKEAGREAKSAGELNDGQHMQMSLRERKIISPGWIEDSVLNSVVVFAIASGGRGITASPTPSERSARVAGAGLDPHGRLGTPADVGNAVAMICAPGIVMITGALVDVDGGASLMEAHLPLEFQGAARRKKSEAA